MVRVMQFILVLALASLFLHVHQNINRLAEQVMANTAQTKEQVEIFKEQLKNMQADLEEWQARQ